MRSGRTTLTHPQKQVDPQEEIDSHEISPNNKDEASKDIVEKTTSTSTARVALKSSDNLIGSDKFDTSSILKEVNIPILVVTSELKIREVFPGKRSFIALSDIGKHVNQIDLQLKSGQIEEAITDVIEKGCSQNLEVQDKQERKYWMRIQPFFAKKEKISCAVITFFEMESFNYPGEPDKRQDRKDIDRLVQMETRQAEAEAESKGKDEFLAVLSHELRTPLHVMLGWTRLLKRKKLDKKTYARCVEVLEQSVTTQARLIDDMLDISRISSGKIKLDKSYLDLKLLLQKIVDFMQPEVEAKDIEISFNLEELFRPVYGDPERIRQVIRNLLSNAIKFTPCGQSIKISLKEKEGNAEIQIVDTGAGIESQFLPFIFEPFRQADSSSSRCQGGLGLGLSIARHIVEMHEGSITADSPGEGKGASFTVILPLAGEAFSSGIFESEEGRVLSLKKRCLKGVRVLFVDDDPSGREVFALALSKWGARIITAGSANEGLEALRKENIDVIVTDIGMPEVNGYAFLEKIRGFPDKKKRVVPVVALTAYARLEDLQKVLAAGFSKYVSKPLEPALLAETILSAIKGNKSA